MSAVAMPSVSDLPIHADKLPSTTEEIVNTLAKIMRIDLEPQTKKDEYTMNVLTGIMLYRHLEQHQRNNIMEMIHNEEHIAHADWWEFIDKCTDVLIQPKWWLWSLTTEELQSVFKEQQRWASIFSFIGISFSASVAYDVVNEFKKNKDIGNKLKNISKKVPLFLIIASFEYANRTGKAQTETELGRRISNPKSSSFYK